MLEVLAGMVVVGFILYFTLIAISNKEEFNDFVDSVEKRTGRKLQFY